MLVVHAGGNDLGLRSMRKLIRDVKFDFLRLRSEYTDLLIVWSDIVAHTQWRWARSVKGINKARVKVTREVVRFLMHNGGLAVRHHEL